jgi:hypothetical protein
MLLDRLDIVFHHAVVLQVQGKGVHLPHSQALLTSGIYDILSYGPGHYV